MIKLKDLLFEEANAFRPKDKSRYRPPYRFYFRVIKPFSAEHLTGVWDKTNQYYGNSQVSKQRVEKITAKKGSVVVNLPGGFWVLDTQKKKAYELNWKSLRHVKESDIEEITDEGEISKVRWDVFKKWEPYKTSFEKKTAKRR